MHKDSQFQYLSKKFRTGITVVNKSCVADGQIDGTSDGRIDALTDSKPPHPYAED